MRYSFALAVWAGLAIAALPAAAQDVAAKAEPGTLAYGTPGAGSSQHLSGEKFKLDAGVDLVHIPYKGSGPSMQDLIAGQIPMRFDTALTALLHITSGKIRALAVTSAKRAKVLPAARFYTMGVEHVPMTPAQFTVFQKTELVKWAKVVKDANLWPE